MFAQYDWEYDFIGRFWEAPDGTKLSQDTLMDFAEDSDGDLALMRLIVERGQRKV